MQKPQVKPTIQQSDLILFQRQAPGRVLARRPNSVLPGTEKRNERPDCLVVRTTTVALVPLEIVEAAIKNPK